MVELKYQYKLERMVPRNPSPSIVPGGDCGACVLAGLLGSSNPRDGYLFDRKNAPAAYEHFSMKETLTGLYYQKEALIHIVMEPPVWLPGHSFELWKGLPAISMSLEWFAYITMAIQAGYYGIASVSHNGEGRHSDHFIMIAGVKNEVHYDDESRTCGVHKNFLLIRDSSLAHEPEYWLEVGTYLEYYGGFNTFLAKPK